MATYLQGVTDYIPDYQPFQPDLNFYSNVMQTKQTQYDTNWKALNNIYSTYYNANLTRDNNIEKKDDHLKNIAFNLKRVSQLDLSLEQNVAQAQQVFKPFYEDKGLMKDMAWTKNYDNEQLKAKSLKGSSDVKDNEKYWDTGVVAMDFMRDEFKNATEDEAMNFGNVSYTPFKNTIKEAQKLAKEAGLSVEKVDFSPDGKWIVKTKNGQNLIEPLSKLFEAQLGSDPAIQEVYKTQSYVDRKSYAKNNASMFGGDENAAEMKYLEDSFTMLKNSNTVRYKQLQAQSKSYDKNIEDLDKQIREGRGTPEIEMQLENFKANKDINDKILASAKDEQETLSGGESATATTSTGFKNPYGDLKTLRQKVDYGMASKLMQKDLSEAANIFAYSNAEVDVDANPYAVNEQKHAMDLAAIAARGREDRLTQDYKNAQELKKTKVDRGTHYVDENGEIVPYENQETVYLKDLGAGDVTAAANFKNESRNISRMKTNDYAMPYMQSVVTSIDGLVKSGKMTEKEASQILGYSKNKNVKRQYFSEKLTKHSDYFLRNEIGQKDLKGIENKFNSWVGQHSEISDFKTDKFLQLKKDAVKFNDYLGYVESDQKWRKDTSKLVEKKLYSEGFKYVQYLYDDEGNLRSEKDFYSKIPQSVKDNHGRSKIEDEIIGGFRNIKGNKSGVIKEINYQELVKAAGKAYSDTKVLKPQIKKLPGLAPGTIDPGTGKYTMGSSAITINYDNPKSRFIFGDLTDDIRSGFDVGDNISNAVSFQGISGEAFRNAKEKGNNKIGMSLLDAMILESQNPKSTNKVFEVAVSPIAAGKSGMSAITFFPTKAFLEKYKGSTDKNDNLLSEGKYVAALKNGITFFMPSSKMNNDMYKNSYSSPLASYVDVMGSYSYTDPRDSRKTYSIEPNTFGTGDYTTTMTYPVYYPEKGKSIVESHTINVGRQGTNLETNRDQVIFDFFNNVDNLNLSNNQR